MSDMSRWASPAFFPLRREHSLVQPWDVGKESSTEQPRGAERINSVQLMDKSVARSDSHHVMDCDNHSLTTRPSSHH